MEFGGDHAGRQLGQPADDGPGQRCYEGLELRTSNWSVSPMAVQHVESSFFDDRGLFPVGSINLDNALLMRDIDHTWHRRPPLDRAGPDGPAIGPAAGLEPP